MEFLICPICERRLKKIDIQHLRSHNLTLEEYRDVYGPDAPYGCSQTTKKAIQDSLSGKSLSGERKRKISASLSSHFRENGHSEKQRKHMSEMWKIAIKEDGTSVNLGKKKTQEQIQKISERSKIAGLEKTRKNFDKYVASLTWATVTKIHAELFLLKCKTCGIESSYHPQTIRRNNFSSNLCKNCHPDLDFRKSNKELELREFISSSYDGVVRYGDRTVLSGFELDVYIPDINLAIEFNGIYWHSENRGKNKNYHLNKTKTCEAKEIRLIHIWENEWDYSKEIVKSRLLSAIGKTAKIPARKCEAREIKTSEAREFLENNHLQGYASSSIKIGLFKDDLLVSVMTFGKPRFNKKYDWELIRYASILNVSVVGGAGKLLSFFIKTHKPNNIISYADRRYSVGKLYEKIGFTSAGASQPNYRYFKNNGLEPRNKFQKHKLPKLLETFDLELTESENMKLNGYDRIFDCGNLVFLWGK